MGDSFITIIAIFLAAILMFIFPLMSISERTDDISQLSVQTATTDFVDKVRTTGKLTLDDYDKFLQTGFEQIKKDYICRNCFLNKQIKVQGFNKITEGTAQEINDNGELVILTDKNNRVILTIGDIL